MVLDGASSFLFSRGNVCRNMDICWWARRRTLLREWRPGKVKELLGFDRPIVRYAQEVNNIRHLIRLVRNVDLAMKYRGRDF